MRSLLLSLLPLTLAATIGFRHGRSPLPPPGSVSVLSFGVDESTTFKTLRARGHRDENSDDDEWDFGDGIHGGGPGCPNNETISHTFALDNSFLTIIFDDFVAQIGPGIPKNESRTFCNIFATLKTPDNWAFDVNNTDTDIFLQLDAGVTSTVTATYEYEGQIGKQSNTTINQGPLDNDVVLHQDGLLLNAGVSTGGEEDSTVVKLSLKAKVETSDPSANGRVSIDNTNERFKHVVQLKWRRT